MLQIERLNFNKLNYEIIDKLFTLHKEMPISDQMKREVFEEEFKVSSREFLVAKQDDEIVGYVSLLDCVYNYDIIGIAVSKAYQKNCIGTKLIDEVKKLAKMNNIETITLEVDEKNINAINFYKKNGFILTKIRKNYYNNSDAHEMQFIV